jgi:hypothetical protein
MRGRDIGEEIRIGNLRPFLRTRLLEKLVEFGEWYIKAPMEDGERVEAVAALMELRRVYVGLSTVYPEDFVELLAKLDQGIDRYLVTARSELIRDYLRSTDPAEIEELSETIGLFIARCRGSWDWEAEFDQAVNERIASPSISPLKAS